MGAIKNVIFIFSSVFYLFFFYIFEFAGEMKEDKDIAEESFFVYDLFRSFWSRVVGMFFREIAERNAHLIPRQGPVIFVVAPHHNQVQYLCCYIC